MSIDQWNEQGRIWEDDHGWLDEEQLAKCARADAVEPPGSPVPTRMVSNGEYMPVAQTEKQTQVESRIAELAEPASKKLGMHRRRFLAGTVWTPGLRRRAQWENRRATILGWHAFPSTC